MTRPAISWQGVFPAVTTQLRDDFSLDINTTAAIVAAPLRDGGSGFVICGTADENTSLAHARREDALFAGLDDVTVESIAMGAVGCVSSLSGLSNTFPREGETLFRLALPDADRVVVKEATALALKHRPTLSDVGLPPL